MNQETEFGYKARQILNQGLENLDSKISLHLQQARQSALDRQRLPVRRLRLAGMGYDFDLINFASHARTLLAVLALTIGATGTYYWNAYAQAQEFEEIDSALLADDLPPSAYLDRGFHAWLERGSDSDSQ